MHGQTIRPFLEQAQIQPRSCSRLLQRKIVDFSADESFVGANRKLLEHYGFELYPELFRRVTLAKAESISDEALCIGGNAKAKHLIAECDGSMIPIVESGCLEGQNDRRKVRKLFWKECKLCFAREIDSIAAYFQATMGDADLVGEMWKSCAIAAGLNDTTKVHCIGDGAPWIREQAEVAFGSSAGYLVDFYHVSEYLGKAAPILNAKDPDAWRLEQQKRLKKGDLYLVLKELEQHLYPTKRSEEPEAEPVRACYRYLTNRLEQLDYLGAISCDLPIGSGEIESSHRRVVQKRLKKPGGWWSSENAASMLRLLSLRANGQWEAYWSTFDTSIGEDAA